MRSRSKSWLLWGCAVLLLPAVLSTQGCIAAAVAAGARKSKAAKTETTTTTQPATEQTATEKSSAGK
jgi:hypothetical protein